MRMFPLPILALLAALAGAKPGPDTALSLRSVEPMFRVQVLERPSCPPSFDLELTADMPDPGWTLAVDRVSDADESGRRVVEITATRAEGAFVQALTPRTAKVPLGCLRKGVYLIDVHLRRGAGRYERVQAVVLRGAGQDAPR
jgi:hypothetical protein